MRLGPWSGNSTPCSSAGPNTFTDIPISYNNTKRISVVQNPGGTQIYAATRIAVPDTPIPFAPAMERAVIPQVQTIVDAIRSVLD